MFRTDTRLIGAVALVAILLAATLAAIAQTPGGSADPSPGGTLVQLTQGQCDSEKIWAGEQQKFSVVVRLSPGARLQSLDLVITHPRVGTRTEPKNVRELRAEELRRGALVDWVVPFTVDGLYTYRFQAQAIAAPTMARFPDSSARILTFRVESRWKVIALVAALIVFGFLIARFLVTGALSQVVRNQTKVAPFSFVAWLAASVLLVWWYFFTWTIWAPVAIGTILLMWLIYVFT